MYQIHITSNLGSLIFSFSNILIYLISLLTIYLLSLCLIHCIKKPTLRLYAASGLLVFFNILIAYHFSSTQQFEWSFFADNTDIILSLDSLYTIIHSLEWANLAYAPFIIGIILFVDYKRKSIRFPKWELTRRFKVIAIILYLGILVSPIISYDPFVSLFRSMIFYYSSPFQLQNKEIIANRHLKTLIPNNIPRTDQPHVFLIIIESLNANYSDYYDKHNQPVMPFLKSLEKEAVSIEYFYGNSIQTAKGNASIFLSAIPSFRGKIFRKFQNVEFDSIFQYIKQKNYQSMVFKGNKHIYYDNTKPFLLSKGLDEMISVNNFLNQEERKYITRWGVDENIIMTKFFDYFDSYTSQHSKPMFSTIITVQSHFPFILPKNMRQVWSEPNSMKQHYANCLKNIDDSIKLFYQKLEERGLSNSIVIITADHAFPMGDQGPSNLEAGYFEESYRIPFIMTAPNIASQQLKGPYSQLDVAPTILDLLNIKAVNSSFVGNSIFSKNQPLVALQIQPYEKQIGVVDLPYKYRYSAKNNKEYVFNIEQDPLEDDNIIATLSSKQLDDFRQKIEIVYNTQRFYELNK
tara:strand:+ start:1501 stop:3228 length:1728 start_codon:yes stop_codon:yes gene_type:complete